MVREPFYTHCPVCATAERSPVIAYPELEYVRCFGCGLVYKASQVQGLGGGYEEDYFRHNRAKYLSRWDHRVRKCRRQLLACLEYAPHASTVLDIGCSAGYVLEAAQRLGMEPTGVDLSSFAVNLCRERGYRAETGALESLPFPDGCFDIVTLKHTLEHVEKPLQALREVRRVMKPGGLALIIVPDAAYYKMAVMPRRGRSFRPDRRGWQHHVYFYEHNLADAAQRAGLAIAKQGKAIFRRRLARSFRWPWEVLRFAWLAAWVWLCRVTRTRRELQLIATQPHA